MSKKLIIFLLFLVFVFLTINFLLNTTSFSKNFDSSVNFENQILGYCPTMENEAFFLNKDKNYFLKKYNSAKDVLVALKNKELDFALIGRISKDS
jgi:hypothetical protein